MTPSLSLKVFFPAQQGKKKRPFFELGSEVRPSESPSVRTSVCVGMALSHGALPAELGPICLPISVRHTRYPPTYFLSRFFFLQIRNTVEPIGSEEGLVATRLVLWCHPLKTRAKLSGRDGLPTGLVRQQAQLSGRDRRDRIDSTRNRGVRHKPTAFIRIAPQKTPSKAENRSDSPNIS
ncbi:hypothetical protein BDW71DRAFT_263 [Aspergillus fruticulosus]